MVPSDAEHLGNALIERLRLLAQFSSEPGALTRLYLSDAHKVACRQVAEWMAAAGLEPEVDAIGNVVGRAHGAAPGQPALLLGSHIDTVRDAGRYDGALGVLAAVAALAELRRLGETLPFPVEIIAFGDEEGVRFPVTLSGSRALAGQFDRVTLDDVDADGISLRRALEAFGCDIARIDALARAPGSVLAYVELHIEQGPVLEARDLPLGIVTAIAGVSRMAVTVRGVAGHAGTVPMPMRRDALTGAAEMVLAIERFARETPGLVATVGQIRAHPGTVNSIPGVVRFSIDMRAAEDPMRIAAVAGLQEALARIATARALTLDMEPTHEAGAVACSPWLQQTLAQAVAAEGLPVFHLPSGAGHDAMALAALCPVGMLFTRCRGGISHNPAESVTGLDAGASVLALVRFLRIMAARSSAIASLE